MFKSVTVIGSVLNMRDSVANYRGTLLLEVNFIENGWQTLSKVGINANGSLEGGDTVRGFEDIAVTPQFRLRFETQDIPFATSYSVRMQRNSVLQIDFGKIDTTGSSGGEDADTQALKERIAALSRENSVLEAKADGADARLQQVQRDCDTRLVDKDKTITELSGELNARDNAVSAVASQEIARLKTDLMGKQIELDRMSIEKDLKATDHEVIKQERDVLKNDLDLIRASDAATPLITDLAGSVAKSIGEATKTTGATSGFSVADAKVTLKGYISDGGQRFKPLDAAEISRTNASAVSEISFSLKPVVTEVENSQQIPDVVGLTPASARRILRPLGNEIQLIEAAGKPAGGIIAQTPRAGQPLPSDALIRLTVATGPAEEG